MLLQFDQKAFKTLFMNTPESVADFAIRLLQEKVQLNVRLDHKVLSRSLSLTQTHFMKHIQHVILHPVGYEKFYQYLEGEFSTESILVRP